MIIDTHVHAFPDALAQRTLDYLASVCHQTPSADGTLTGTRAKCTSWKVDRACFLPIVTKPKNQTKINDFAASAPRDFWIPFGSVHPESPDALEELHRIKEMGLYGVKLHPVYQDFYISEDRMLPIYETITKLGLPVVFHAGDDPLSPGTKQCTPRDCARVLDTFPHMKVILAHMGGIRMAEDVLCYLVGREVYFDTAVASLTLPVELYQELVDAHGTSHILFGTDCPWSTAPAELEHLRKLKLTPDQWEDITHRNAERLFHLPQSKS